MYLSRISFSILFKSSKVNINLRFHDFIYSFSKNVLCSCSIYITILGTGKNMTRSLFSLQSTSSGRPAKYYMFL